MILNKNNNTCLHYVFLNAHLSIIKYLINTYDLIQNDFMKINIYHKNCLHILFEYYDENKFHHKMCIYIFNKYNFTKNDVLTKNKWHNDYISSCCIFNNYNSLKYLIIKYKFTINDLILNNNNSKY